MFSYTLLKMIAQLLAVFVFVICLLFLYTFCKEKEKRATAITFFMICIFAAVIVILHTTEILDSLLPYGVLLSILSAAVLLLPIGKKERATFVGKLQKYDERDIMFARIRYKPNNKEYIDYYSRNPGKKNFDDALRKKPQLGEPGSDYFDTINSPISESFFDMLEKWRPLVAGERHKKVTEVSPEIITRRLKGLILYLGAIEVGVAKIKPHHVYSHIGRGEGGYGTVIDLPHEYAIVFAVRMNYAMISNAPRTAVTIESSRYYVEAAKIGLVVAEYLRYLGFEARTHMDGNYRLILPAVAVDAGLGELGRLNLLITRTDGPRIRLGAISTNCTLVADHPIVFGVQDFCARCKKCAENCPSNAIPKGEKKVIRGVQKWATNQEACFHQWLEFGTDCALCIRVCPYSKPNTFGHKIIRYAVEQSCISRQLATWSDDLFYGKYPAVRDAPEWLK